MEQERMIDTIKGDLLLSSLRREVRTERVPCGVSRTTSYYLGDELVKQDVDVHVDTLEPIAGETGRVA